LQREEEKLEENEELKVDSSRRASSVDPGE
jgi:hypothetical protein